MIYINTTELYHHGIKGQKWGVRRFQDYSGRLTNAGRQRKKDDKIDKKIEEYVKSGKAHVNNLKSYSVGGLTNMSVNDGKSFVSGLMNGHDFDWQEVDKYDDGLFHNPAEMIKMHPEYHKNQNEEDNINHSQKYKLSYNDLKLNNFGYGEPGTLQNCAKCTANLELRLRGYDLAAGRQTYPSSVDAPSLWFNGAKRVDYNYSDTESALRSYGKGTSGMLSIRYPNNAGGHALHWTNHANGEFTIEDGQNASMYNSLRDVAVTYGIDKEALISTFRLDNCEPNWDAMASDSVVRLPTQNNMWDKVKNKWSGEVVDTW